MVTLPAAAPASAAQPVARNGLTPCEMSVAATAAPSGKLPSTVMSGNFRIRNVSRVPSATMPNSSPDSSAPSNV